MIKKLLYVLGLSCLVITVKAQNLKVVGDTLDFGTATELLANSANMKVYNTASFAIHVSDIDFFKIYGDAPFTLQDTAFTVMPQDTYTVHVNFLPEHNILHKMALVIKTTSGLGDVAVPLKGQGTYSNTYYSTTQNKSEQALQIALKAKLAQNYSSLGYNVARDNMYASIDNHGGDVTCIYTGRVATFNTRAGANNNNFNCEHTFPQGYFNSNEPMKSDIHHLYPTDNTANSQRGNNPFGLVTNPSWQQGGSKSNSSTFEPRDVQKGPTARSMMYFVVRYQDYSNFFQGQEAILRSWHEQYPPDSAEKARNNQIYALQNNRNPFVDYPQFAERITSLVANVAPPSNRKLYASDDTISLAQGNGRLVYDFVLYNDGNETLQLSSFALSDTSLHFANGNPSNIALEPQEETTIKISFNAANHYMASLDFMTNVPGQVQMSIPIESGPGIGIKEYLANELGVYPNPTQGALNVQVNRRDVDMIRITNMSGQSRKVYLNEQSQLHLEGQAPGLYLITVITKSGRTSSARVVVY